MKLLTGPLDLDVIRTDGGTQVREKLDDEWVNELVALYDEHHEIEPILVVLDRQGIHWLADGFHRVEAMRRLGYGSCEALVRDGETATLDLAKMLASQVKQTGRPLLPGDKRRAVLMARSTPGGRAMGVPELARHCGVTKTHVADILNEGKCSVPDTSSPSTNRSDQERGSEAAKEGASGEGASAGTITGGSKAMIVSRPVILAGIRTDGETQAREKIDPTIVDEYAEAMRQLVEFPPIVVFNDGTDTWLADGFHRYRAAMKIEATSLRADWRVGTREAAKLYAASANDAHGLRRTAGDKFRAIEMVLSTEEGRNWTQEKIAEHCHVDRSYVSKVKAKCDSHNRPKNAPPPQPTKTERKRATIAEAIAAAPKASDRAIGRRLGVDRETVAAVRAQSTAEPGLPGRRGRRSRFACRRPPMNLSSAEADKTARALLDHVRAACTVLTKPDWKAVLAEIEAIVSQ